ncbi:OLC1v1006271C1 [Oldenlandia corymbosa var. corymbosa]|uniref:pyruvate decarboxylase n=1 Tax=Oldenlandia corymbosa var. corymbosa TaxID=529605 RepID=A0AAV1DJX9_OLDCO|nr:OLC1v1006271C1 [Oldenlandia corymbosa var. corymbosa]
MDSMDTLSSALDSAPSAILGPEANLGPNTNDYGTNRILHHTIGLPDFSQELSCFQTVTCYQAVVTHLDAHEQIDRAISTALKESKPVYISISCNLPGIPHPTFAREPIPFSISPRSSNKAGLKPAAEAAAAFLGKAVKPVIIGGSKLRVSEAQDAFVELTDARGYAQSAPEKHVIACIGDGSFQVTAQDVTAMIRNNQKSIIFLINNGGYTIEVEIDDGPYNVIKNWNYTAVVDAFWNGAGNCWTTKVRTEEELIEAIEIASGEKKDSLCFIEVFTHKDDTSKELLEWGSRVAAADCRPPNPH